MGIKKTLLKALFITGGAALGITGSVYALDKFEERYRNKQDEPDSPVETVEQPSEENTEA